MKTSKTQSTIRLHLSVLALAFAIGAPVAHAEATPGSVASPATSPTITTHSGDVTTPTMSPKASRRLAKASFELSEGMAGFQDMLPARGGLSAEGEALAATQQWQKSAMP